MNGLCTCTFAQVGNKPGVLPGVRDWRIGAVLEHSSGMPIEISNYSYAPYVLAANGDRKRFAGEDK